MLCYRCGSHVPDGSSECGTCGQAFAASGKKRSGGSKSSGRRRPPQKAGAYDRGDLIAGRYEVKGVVGEGPVGVVYRARDREVDVQVAVKVLGKKLVQAPEEKRAFAQEARIARSLSHKNVIRLYDEAIDGDHPFVVMQHLEGLTLRKIIDLRLGKGETFPVDEIGPIFHQLLDALAYCHGQRDPEGKPVAHADLKPSNVIVLPDLLKVSDFRQSLMVPRVPFVAAQKVRGGDAGYLAPELVAGEEVTPAADFYSVGVLLGEMLTGKIYDPATGLDPHLQNDEISVAYTSIFKRLTATKPRDRYKKIAHLQDDLALALEGKAPRHVGAFRAEVTKMEKVESAPLQILHTGEFEALEGSDAERPPGSPSGEGKRSRESFGLEAPSGMAAEAPPLGEDDDVLGEELLADEEAFDDDEYEDDEYLDDSEDISDDDILTTVAASGPEAEASAPDAPAKAAQGEVAGEGLEILLERKAEEIAALEEQGGLAATIEDEGSDDGATVPEAPSLDAMLAERSTPEGPLLDDLLDAAHDIPAPSDTDPQVASLGPPVDRTGPVKIGTPPAPRAPTRASRAMAPRSSARARQENSWATPALVALGVLLGLGALAVFTKQGQALWRQDPTTSAVPDEAVAASGVASGVPLAGATETNPEPGPTPPTPTPPPIEETGRESPPLSPSDSSRGERARPKEARAARMRRDAAEATRARRADARKQAADERARRDASRREAAAEAKARRKAESDAQMAEIIAQERRRQEAEAARRGGGAPSTGSGRGGRRSGSSAFSFDTVDRDMPVRPIGGGTEPVRGQTPPPKAPPETAPAPVVASKGPPPSVPQDVRCPKGMTYVPSGAFPFGSAANDPMRNFAEKRLSQVQVPGYCIDRFEYGSSRPTVRVTWFKAKELCERRGKRLCSEKEWEKACKGPRGLRFPYGNAFDPDACNSEDAEGNDRSLTRSGSFRRCRSGHGVYDMAGNAAEWTASVFQSGAAYRTIKGGGANRPDWDTRCATRGNRKPNTKDAFLGFRCCTSSR